jgi:serine/threonine protein kinase
VALKQLTANSEDLKNEAKILQQLRHPNIITYYGWFQDKEKQNFLVMEFCAFSSLNVFMDQRQISVEQKLSA